MEEQGLGAQAVQQSRNQQDPMRAVQEVVAMLQQGMGPEELIQKGVPRELVEAALMMLEESATQVPADQAGLAGMLMNQKQVVGA